MQEATRVSELEDVAEIANLKARYVDAADGGWTGERAHKGDVIASLFVAEGVWDADDMGQGVGHEGIRAYFAGAVEDFPMVFHHTSSPRIQVEGDEAKGRWHVMVPMIDKGVSKILIGIYDDEFVRTPDGWRFKRLHFAPAGLADLPEGWQVF